MLQVNERYTGACKTDDSVKLPFERRQRSRLRTPLDGGEEVAFVLPRGGVLRAGDRLRSEDGRVIEVFAARETVSTVRATDTALLARACYHLGNRHVRLEIGEGWVRYLHDHVFDHMVEEMGLAVTVESAPFEPEAGAYRNAHAH